MQIQISVQRPWLTASCLLLLAAMLTVRSLPQTQATDIGGQGQGASLAQAQESADRERIRQAVLADKEEILRYEVQTLESEATTQQSPEAAKQLAEHRAVLLEIIKQRSEAEKLLASSLEQLWDGQGTAFSLDAPQTALKFQWPVEPHLGISAYFEDDAYFKRFHIQHHAIDIPTEQGTPITAPADGTVIAAKDNGLGFSYITLAHADGLETTYGHVSKIMVTEGEHIYTGQVIGLSGGQPGSPGAGLMTTGAHLHFAVRYQGKLVDPLKYLVKYAGDIQE